MKTIIVGSRRSHLAKAQANLVIDMLRNALPDVSIIHKLIGSDGDRDRKTKLSEMGGVGAFTKEIQEYLINKEIDIAVHSLKDLPTQLPAELQFVATLQRENPSDALCGSTLSNLKHGAKIGTGSLRRTAQMLSVRPDVQIIPIRGNVPPRLSKLKGDNPLDAVILASAGLNRLELTDKISEHLDIYKFLPSAGQGALGLEVRKEDDFVIKKISTINHLQTFNCVSIERHLLHKLHGGCSVPIGTYCKYLNETLLEFSASITSLDGQHIAFAQKQFVIENSLNAIEEIYNELISKGGGVILENIKASKIVDSELSLIAV